MLLEGTLLLMDTAGILDCVLGALSLGFILSLDEMLPRGPEMLLSGFQLSSVFVSDDGC